MNQASYSTEDITYSTLMLAEPQLEPTFPEEPIMLQKPKNVPEELKMFLKNHPDQWYTNEQLADQLNHTASGIRNAVTKLKNTGLIKTRMTGPLAYRGWHTASLTQPLPMPEMQKRLASRKCNRCETTYSRYWRSDLEEPNKWLCNNCGMNQRRGRLHRQNDGSKSKRLEQVNIQHHHHGHDNDDEEHNHHLENADEYYDPSSAMMQKDHDLIHINIPQSSQAVQSQNYRSTSSDTRRRCANCGTYKSAGKWRRDRENFANYLCNKCGMNQRRASLRKTNELQKTGMAGSYSNSSLVSGDSTLDGNTYRGGNRKVVKQKVSVPSCSRCGQAFPSLEVEPCKHRFCGECIPVLVHQALGKNSLECPECKSDSPDALPVLIATAILGGFLLETFDQN